MKKENVLYLIKAGFTAEDINECSEEEIDEIIGMLEAGFTKDTIMNEMEWV